MAIQHTVASRTVISPGTGTTTSLGMGAKAAIEAVAFIVSTSLAGFVAVIIYKRVKA